MRDLTQQEIDNAPAFCDRYSVGVDGSLIFYAEHVGAGRPIPRKPFDISGHNFSDTISEIKVVSANAVGACIKRPGEYWIMLDKQDAIALAKHFKLASKDLK